jgi:hypothetical protein
VPTLVLEGYQLIQGENEAKLWLQPVAVAYSRGCNGPELNGIVKLAEKNRARLPEAWNAYFGG